MSFFRGAGKFTGKAIGTVIGEPLKFVGKKLDNEFGDFVEEVGKGVKNASEFSFDSAGQALDGVWNTSSGVIQKDPRKQQQGLDDLKDAGGRTPVFVKIVVAFHLFVSIILIEGRNYRASLAGLLMMKQSSGSVPS